VNTPLLARRSHQVRVVDPSFDARRKHWRRREAKPGQHDHRFRKIALNIDARLRRSIDQNAPFGIELCCATAVLVERRRARLREREWDHSLLDFFSTVDSRRAPAFGSVLRQRGPTCDGTGVEITVGFSRQENWRVAADAQCFVHPCQQQRRARSGFDSGAFEIALSRHARGNRRACWVQPTGASRMKL
jgi:hypothetical protein